MISLYSVVNYIYFVIHVHSDINECSDGIHLCQQICNNTHGSHNCACFNGYELNTNGFSCQGRFKFTSLVV